MTTDQPDPEVERMVEEALGRMRFGSPENADHARPILRALVTPLVERIRDFEEEASVKSAAEQALDDIAECCGCPEWEYPGQVVRDVWDLRAQVESLTQSAKDTLHGINVALRGKGEPATTMENALLFVHDVAKDLEEADDQNADLRAQVERLMEAFKRQMHALEDSRPLCPDHRDKQRGKDCLACEVERLTRERDEARAR